LGNSHVDFFLYLWYITNKDQNSLKEWVFMQKTFKILGIIALTAVIGFSMAACKGESEPDPNIITITGIPQIYVGKVGALMLSTSASEKNYPVYSIETITGTSFSFPMRDWNHDSRPWDGSGSFGITIFIFNSIEDARNKNEDKSIYKGVKPGNTDITELTTTLEWSSFVQKP
jgi:hypothetical protein